MFNPKVLKTYINVGIFQSHKSLMLVHYKKCTSSQQLCNQNARVNVIDTISKLRGLQVQVRQRGTSKASYFVLPHF
jgi:hypothetical protein